MPAAAVRSIRHAVIFVGVRIGGVYDVSPVFGSSGIPLQVKAGLTMALTVLLFPWPDGGVKAT